MTTSVMTSVDVNANAKTEPFRQLAGRAADYIREHGWCQGASMDAHGRVCLIGAKNWVADTLEAGRALTNHLCSVLPSHPLVWNDDPDRAESEVVGVLDAISEGWL
jgi:hypothetical protein